MAFTALRGMKPFPQLMFTIFVILTSFIIFFVASLVLAIPLFGMSSISMIPNINDLFNPEAVNILKYFQVVQSIGLFVVPPLILGWLYSGKFSVYLHLNKTFTIIALITVVILMFAVSPVINLLGEINSKMHLPEWLSGIENWMRNTEDNADKLTEVFLNVKTFGGLMFNLFMIAFLPAIGEELLFRGVIQRIFTRMTKNHHWGIWISAILFSALHMQFYGFIPRMLLGVLFGYLLVWSGSLWLPVIAHLLNNGIAVIAAFLINNDLLSSKLENIGSTGDSIYWAGIGFVITILLLWFFKRENQNNNLPVPMQD